MIMGKAIIIKDVDFSLVGLGKVTPIEVTPLISLTINGDDAIEKYGNYSVSYFPYTTNERRVEWSIVSGSEYASINNGKVSVKLNVDNQPVTIRVTSKIRPEIYAEKTIYVTGANKLLDVDQVFTGTTSEAIVTDYKLLTDEMPEWTLLTYCPNDSSSTINVQRCAIHCMYETSPYPGFVRQTQSNKVGMGFEIRGSSVYYMNKNNKGFATTNTNAYTTSSEVPVAISKSNNVIYYSFDGITYTPLNGFTITKIDCPLVIGAKRQNNGTLVQPYNSGTNKMRVVLIDSEFQDVSNIINEYNN